MAFLLGYGSAVEWLRQNHDVGPLSTRFGLPMLSLEASRTRLQRHKENVETLTWPIHLVVSLRDSRRPSAETTCHLLTTPDGIYPCIRIDQGIFCSGPEFAFLQMASVLDEETLRFLGMELCGQYGIGSDGKLFLRPQTCRPDDLLQTALAMSTVRGRKRAEAVAPQVWGGAASPEEVALTLILSASIEQGGFGITPPELNKPLLVTGHARDLWSDDFITPDLLWEQGKVVIEYDSDLHHSASHRIARDSMRRDVLTELGYRVITVTAAHMRSPIELQRVAGIVMRQLGQEMPKYTDEQWSTMVDFQLRMRQLAEHPDKLLGFADKSHPTRRNWHVRSVEERS